MESNINLIDSVDLEKNEKIRGRQKILCPQCASNVIKCGKRYLRRRAVQQYLCKNPKCGYRFYLKPEAPVWSMS